ncbi:2-dehydropantoate 2-reductase [Poronia punctata]|nr:2-dehydropantoate 2-reductase [Poronia punctata]
MSETTPPRVLIFGTGSMGAVYGWILSQASPKPDITAICRSNYDAALRDGFTLNSTIWGNGLLARPRIVRTVAEAVCQAGSQPFDYILVTVKALPMTPSAAELIRPAITPAKTAVVLIQNGIGIEDEYARLYAGDDVAILSTVAYLPATRTSPTEVSHREIEHLLVGTFPATGVPQTHKDAARKFVDMVQSGGGTATLYDDVQPQRWGKLLINGSWNPVCALVRLRDRQFMNLTDGEDADNEAYQFIRDLMLEIASIAQACGYTEINENMVQHHMERLLRRPGDGLQPSMLADTLEGRELEVDAIVGNAVRIANEKKVPVPMLRTVYILAKGLSSSLCLAK